MPDVSSTKQDSTGANRESASEQQPPSDSQVTSSTAAADYRIRCPRLPLAVYREIAAHLRQIDGVNAGLLPQSSQTFDYLTSQVGGLWISYQYSPHQLAQQQVERVLAYYGDRFGSWEVV
ncbi:MAG: hypothetical protein VKL39_14170 [Leptolyngbyaceae bacterium]|nr:hypothetical protein [Leptolyngbyaceae bacterium]